MRKRLIGLAIALCFSFAVVAQTNEKTEKTVVESVYILPKKGMADEFEKAIKAHNEKFHPTGDYVAGLRKVEYGDKAGWYVWIMGPTTYTALDSRPTKENGHEDDWNKTVEPFVEKYGPVNLWNYNEKLSFGKDILMKAKHYEAWAIDLKRGQYYRFKEIAKKLMKTSEKMGVAFLIFNNPLHTSHSADVGMVWDFKSYADWSTDNGFKKEFEKLYGEGSWQNMYDEWLDITNDYNAELRTIIR